MKVLNILHISDSHIQEKDRAGIAEITKKLIDDIKKIRKQRNISIDLICFTGDLIQRGDKALEDEKQWKLAMDIMINPLLRELDLSNDRFIFVPGNHEVDITKIVPRLEKGLEIESLQDINEIMDDFDSSYKNRLSYFYEIVKEQLPDVKFRDLGYSYSKQINGINVGISCVDSAWRSSGKGVIEKNKLKNTVTLLTQYGVVKIKVYKSQFVKFDRQAFTKDEITGKKTITEKSWFSRGNKLLIQGIRRGDFFIPKAYKGSEYKPITLISSIDYSTGKVTYKTDRED